MSNISICVNVDTEIINLKRNEKIITKEYQISRYYFSQICFLENESFGW